jgi:hypothetical protein
MQTLVYPLNRHPLTWRALLKWPGLEVLRGMGMEDVEEMDAFFYEIDDDGTAVQFEKMNPVLKAL